MGPNEIKMIYNGKRPQKIKSWMSQEQLIQSSSFQFMLKGPTQNWKLKTSKYLKLTLRGPNQNWQISWSEDDLKIFKSWISQQPPIRSSSNFKHTQVKNNNNLNFGLCDQPKVNDNLSWKTTFTNNRGISQKLLI